MVNRVTLTGYLGADPDIRVMPSGESVAHVRMATTERYREKTSGSIKEATEWHRTVFYGRMADVARQYLVKGSRVYVEGRLHTRKWQADGGQDRYTTEVVIAHLEMLGGTRLAPGEPADTDRSATGISEWAEEYDRAAAQAGEPS